MTNQELIDLQHQNAAFDAAIKALKTMRYTLTLAQVERLAEVTADKVGELDGLTGLHRAEDAAESLNAALGMCFALDKAELAAREFTVKAAVLGLEA